MTRYVPTWPTPAGPIKPAKYIPTVIEGWGGIWPPGIGDGGSAIIKPYEGD